MTRAIEGQPRIERGAQSDTLREQLELHHLDASGWSLACCDHDEDRAHDVLHEAYVRVLDGRARYRAESSFRTWLFGVIRLVALEAHRRDQGHDVRRDVRRDVDRGADVAVAAAPPSESLEQAELVARLSEALTKLTARQREVMHLVFYQSLTLEEASRVMEVGVGTARTHYHRAKTRLRKELNQELNQELCRSLPRSLPRSL